MGRKQLPLAGNNELERFALRLRQARAAAGMTVRQLAERAGYSVGTIAKAESGRHLPSWEVTETLAQACGTDPAALRRAWYLLADSTDEVAPPSGSPVERKKSTHDERVRRWRWLLTGSALTALAAVLVSLVTEQQTPSQGTTTSSATTTVTPRPIGEPQAVADGSDPKRAGCGSDATTIDAVEMPFPDTTLAGSVELRFSPSCRMAWSRFVPLPALDHFDGVVVTVVVERPATNTALPFSMDFPHGEVWSDILTTRTGCVVAKAEITTNDRTTGIVTTRCLTG